jgi:dihydroflavonol-4-reductase
MKVGVTGANGFIGNHLVRHLRRQGHQPYAFLQTGTSAEVLGKEPEKVFWGDLTEGESLDSFIKECEVVLHLAGINRYWCPDPRVFQEVNVKGVQRVAEACLRYGVRKLVHASSCITLGASDIPEPRDETAEFNLNKVPFLYATTKKAGEECVKQYVRERGLPAVIIHPTSAVGEMDFGPTPIGKPIADICRGIWPAYVAGGACFIDVHDVVEGFWLAMEKGRIGEQYLLAGDNLTNQDFMTKVSLLAGRKKPRVKVPRTLLTGIARGGEWWANRVSGKPPVLTRGMVSVIGKYLYFDGSKARRELGFAPQKVDGAIQRCIDWFREEKRI